MNYASFFYTYLSLQISLSPPRSSNRCDFLIEGPLILIGYRKILLDFSVTLRMDSEQLSAKLSINEVQKVMESR